MPVIDSRAVRGMRMHSSCSLIPMYITVVVMRSASLCRTITRLIQGCSVFYGLGQPGPRGGHARLPFEGLPPKETIRFMMTRQSLRQTASAGCEGNRGLPPLDDILLEVHVAVGMLERMGHAPWGGGLLVEHVVVEDFLGFIYRMRSPRERTRPHPGQTLNPTADSPGDCPGCVLRRVAHLTSSYFRASWTHQAPAAAYGLFSLGILILPPYPAMSLPPSPSLPGGVAPAFRELLGIPKPEEGGCASFRVHLISSESSLWSLLGIRSWSPYSTGESPVIYYGAALSCFPPLTLIMLLLGVLVTSASPSLCRIGPLGQSSR